MAESHAFCCCWSALVVGNITRKPPPPVAATACVVVAVVLPIVPSARLGTTSITLWGYRREPPVGSWTKEGTAASSTVPVRGRLRAVTWDGCCAVDTVCCCCWMMWWWWWRWFASQLMDTAEVRIGCEGLLAPLHPRPGDRWTRPVEEAEVLKDKAVWLKLLKIMVRNRISNR